MKYIDAKKLIAELRCQKHELELSIKSQGDYGQSCQIVAYENIISLIGSLQQEHPEVDLEKEIHKYFNPYGMKLQFDRSKGNTILKPEQLINFANYFYKLGLNTRKEEK